MGFNLRQGFQYPFPFPFYNFSYHTMNPDVTNQKYQRLRINNYIDIRLNKGQPKKKKKTRAPKKSSVSQDASPQRLVRQESAISENSQEFTFQKVTPRDIAFDIQTVGELEDDDDGYTTDEAARILQDENRAVPTGQQGFVFVPSIFQHLVLPGGLTSGPATRLSSLHEIQEPPLASVQRPDLPALLPHQNPQLLISSPQEGIKKRDPVWPSPLFHIPGANTGFFAVSSAVQGAFKTAILRYTLQDGFPSTASIPCLCFCLTPTSNTRISTAQNRRRRSSGS